MNVRVKNSDNSRQREANVDTSELIMKNCYEWKSDHLAPRAEKGRQSNYCFIPYDSQNSQIEGSQRNDRAVWTSKLFE